MDDFIDEGNGDEDEEERGSQTLESADEMIEEEEQGKGESDSISSNESHQEQPSTFRPASADSTEHQDQPIATNNINNNIINQRIARNRRPRNIQSDDPVVRQGQNLQRVPRRGGRRKRMRNPDRNQQSATTSNSSSRDDASSDRSVRFHGSTDGAKPAATAAVSTDDQDEDDENDQVDLLEIARQRSHGIYLDGSLDCDKDDTDDDNDDETDTKPTSANRTQHHQGDLLESTNETLREEKLRHLHGNHAAVEDPPASAIISAFHQDDADAKAKARAMNGNTGTATTTTTINRTNSPHDNTHSVQSSNRSSAGEILPGAYQGAPGRSFVRTQEFQGILQQPMLDENPSVRSSANAMTINLDVNTSTTAGTTLMSSTTTSAPPRTAPIDYTTSGQVIAAVRVDEDDLELHIRDEINNNAAQAEVVDMDKETADLVESKLNQVRKRYYVYGAILLVALGVTIGALTWGIMAKKANDDSNDPDALVTGSYSTLEAIRERGYLNCGITARDEKAVYDQAYLEGGVAFNNAICTAIAAAALGGHKNVSIHGLKESERWLALENGTVDVLLVGTPGVLKSLYWNLDPTIPVTFSTPYYFDGVGTGGMPSYIRNCADVSDYVNYMSCRDLVVCVLQGSLASEIAMTRLHPSQIVTVSSLKDLYNEFASGCCNVISTDYSNERSEDLVRDLSGHQGPYQLGTGLFSFQPYAAATRKLPWGYDFSNEEGDVRLYNDPHVWSEFVNWIINALIYAEENNITQSTAYKLRQTNAFGNDYRRMFEYAVAAVGNYGEIYERTRQKTVPRAGMNKLNNGTTGLHYSQSLGDLAEFGPPPYEDGTISTIVQRGVLICGIPMPQNFTSLNLTTGEMDPVDLNALRIWQRLQLEGINPTEYEHLMGTANVDIDYCRALASSVFLGQQSATVAACTLESHKYDRIPSSIMPRLQFVLLENEADGYSKLANGEVDVIAGYRESLRSDVREPTTDRGYSFTQPYLYGPTTGRVTDANRCLVTRQHDGQWSSFCQSIVMALFYAEENQYTQSQANLMPVLNRFGPTYKRALRDAVFTVGNYGELYRRSVEPVLPRQGGPNMLNTESDPQFASMPGLMRKVL